MKKKIIKTFAVILSFTIMLVCGVSPAVAMETEKEPQRGVNSAYTDTYNPHQYECYGVVTVYPIFGSAATYCELASAGKQVYVKFQFYRYNYVTDFVDNANYYDLVNSGSGGTYYGQGSTLLNAQTSFTVVPSDYLSASYAYSRHRVKLDNTGIGWDSEGSGDSPTAYY